MADIESTDVAKKKAIPTCDAETRNGKLRW